ncbi:zinc ribbon domain-containing protein [Kocuria sp.]|uniref:zinc ribbon domain-containing protein n=1 Tax=Kocuria sp. TaxID=1871328 RepID=UPI0026DCD324|nr:C4-type zinc ribbon domain-containing protein [Kocuria sp.]MDO4919998.1 C4-type zinc ribbon domain-containing protein [Kocuria sp.]
MPDLRTPLTATDSQEIPMTAARSFLPALLELQRVDSQLLTTLRRAKELQTSEAVAALVTRRTQAVAAARELDAALQRAQDAVREAESAVAGIQSRIDRDTRRLNAGGTSKDLMGIQHQIDTLTAQRGRAEEEQLQAMDRAEEVAADRERKQPLLRAADTEARTAVAERDAELSRLKDEHARLTAERARRAAAVTDASVLERYDRLRTARGGGRIAVARWENGTCGACDTRLSPADAAALEATPETGIPQCPECSAMLVL